MTGIWPDDGPANVTFQIDGHWYTAPRTAFQTGNLLRLPNKRLFEVYGNPSQQPQPLRGLVALSARLTFAQATDARLLNSVPAAGADGRRSRAYPLQVPNAAECEQLTSSRGSRAEVRYILNKYHGHISRRLTSRWALAYRSPFGDCYTAVFEDAPERLVLSYDPTGELSGLTLASLT